MSLLQALAFPLRNPVRYVLLAGVHCLMLSIPLSGIVYSEWYDGLPSADNAFALSMILLICYGIWIHTRAVLSLRRLFTGGRSLPSLSVSDFLPRGLRSIISSLILLTYVGMFPIMTHELYNLARWSRSPYEWMDHAELVNELQINAVAATIGTIVMLVNLIGVARYAAMGGEQVTVALKAQVSHIRRNRRATLQYLLRQLVLLAAAALLIRFGSVLGGDIRPYELRDYHPENMLALAWSTLGVFVYSCGFVMVWNASLHLLAQYAKAIGICGDGYKMKMDKSKNDFT